MTGQWPEIARFSFDGAFYEEYALNTHALEELVQFQKILTNMAVFIWKEKHPNRLRIPNNFKECTQFVIRRIEDGSVIVPLEIPRSSYRASFSDSSDVVAQAIDRIYRVFAAADCNRSLPFDIPKEVVSNLATLGKKLRGGAVMKFAPPGRELIEVTAEVRQRLETISEYNCVDEIEVTGQVIKSEIDPGQFEILTTEDTKIRVRFSKRQESKIGRAFSKNVDTHFYVKVQGEIKSDGVLQIRKVKYLGENFGKKLEDVIFEIFSDIPENEWDRVPTDLSYRHDHYLYGNGKR